MRRFLTLLLLIALAASACGDDAGPDPAADTATEVLDRIEQALGAQEPPPSEELVVPEGCRIVIETDEYDFETEVVVCDDDPSATTTTTTLPPGSDAVAAWTGTQEARQTAQILGRLLIAQTGCDDPADLQAAAEAAATAPDEVRTHLLAAIGHLEQAAVACDQPEAWRTAMDAALDDLEVVNAVMRGSDD